MFGQPRNYFCSRWQKEADGTRVTHSVGRGEERVRFGRPTGALYAAVRARRIEENCPQGPQRDAGTFPHSSRVRRYVGPVTMTADQRESTRVFGRLLNAKHLLSSTAPRLSGVIVLDKTTRQEITDYIFECSCVRVWRFRCQEIGIDAVYHCFRIDYFALLITL